MMSIQLKPPSANHEAHQITGVFGRPESEVGDLDICIDVTPKLHYIYTTCPPVQAYYSGGHF